MYIQSIQFEQYRNLDTFEIQPAQGINVIYGDNAQGKTNLLESLWLFTGGRSFRGAKDKELIAFGAQYAHLKLRFYAENRDQTLEIHIANNRRTAVLNDVPKGYMSQIIGHFCAVIFSPQHLTLVKNGPEERRNFIDSAVCQIKPSYVTHLSRYRRILNERNALLKDIPRHPELADTLDIWNEHLAYEGAIILTERLHYMEQFAPIAATFYGGISNGKEQLDLVYRSALSTESDADTERLKIRLYNLLQKKQKDDIACGYTTVGIHRDDIGIKINGHDARSFGSQGQQRSAVLALKLAEAEVLGQKKQENPIILLDDVLSELDASRQNYLLHRLEGKQVFITCCEDDIQAEHTIHIHNGAILS